MKRWIKTLMPVSLLGFLSLIVVSTTVDSAPTCALPDESLVVDNQTKENTDERVYHVGCGGLF